MSLLRCNACSVMYNVNESHQSTCPYIRRRLESLLSSNTDSQLTMDSHGIHTTSALLKEPEAVNTQPERFEQAIHDEDYGAQVDQESYESDYSYQQGGTTHNFESSKSYQDLDFFEKYALKLYKLKVDCGMSRQQYQMITDFTDGIMRHFVPGFKGLSEYKTKKLLLSLYPIKPVLYDICRSGCVLYFNDNLTCPTCGLDRYSYSIHADRAVSRTPGRQMKVLTLSDQLALLMYHENTRNLLFSGTSFDERGNTYTDIFDGTICKSMNPQQTDIFLTGYIDGYGAKNKPAQSLELLQFIINNLHPSIRYKSQMILQYANFPGPQAPTNNTTWSYITPLCEELVSLGSRGITVACDDGITRTSLVFMVVFTGDLPAVASLAGHTGHQSTRYCRICLAHKVLANGTHPIHWPVITNVIERGIDLFKNGDNLMNQKPTPAVMLSTFFDAYLFGLDEMHMIGMGVCKQLIGLIVGNYDGGLVDGTKLSKDKNWWKTFKKDLETSRPSIPKKQFDGSFRFPWSKHTTRAVDWIALVLYVVPALVVPCLDSEGSAAVMSLVHFIQMTQEKELTDNDLLMMDEDLAAWNIYVQQKIYSKVITYNFSTPNHHYMSHVTTAIRKLGPMYAYSARSMERSIGNMKRLVKSNRDSGTNAMNVMVERAAMTYSNQQSGGNLEALFDDSDGTSNDNDEYDDDEDDNDDSDNEIQVYMDLGDGSDNDDDDDYDDTNDDDGNDDDGNDMDVDDGGMNDDDMDIMPQLRRNVSILQQNQSNWPRQLHQAFQRCPDLFDGVAELTHSKSASFDDKMLAKGLYAFVKSDSTSEITFGEMDSFVQINNNVYAITSLYTHVTKSTKNHMYYINTTDNTTIITLMDVQYIYEQVGCLVNSRINRRYFFWKGWIAMEDDGYVLGGV